MTMAKKIKYHEVDTLNIPKEIAGELQGYLEKYGDLNYIHEIICHLWYGEFNFAKKIRYYNRDSIALYADLHDFFNEVFGCIQHQILSCKKSECQNCDSQDHYDACA